MIKIVYFTKLLRTIPPQVQDKTNCVSITNVHNSSIPSKIALLDIGIGLKGLKRYCSSMAFIFATMEYDGIISNEKLSQINACYLIMTDVSLADSTVKRPVIEKCNELCSSCLTNWMDFNPVTTLK